MPKLVREPLLHFLILGAALFLVFEFTQEEAGPGERTIVSCPTVILTRGAEHAAMATALEHLRAAGTM